MRRWRLPPGAGTLAPSSMTQQPREDGNAVRIRVDSGVEEGDAVGTYYDPMIAKVVVWGPDRRTALSGLGVALAQTQVSCT